MKKLTNRVLSVLLVLAMCLSLLGSFDFTAGAATVDYVYANGIIKNWGVRGTAATFLSQNAEAFYEDYGTSYEELAKLPGATATSDVPDSALFNELHMLMFDCLDLWSSYQTQYDKTRYQYQYTDVQNSGKTNSKISSFYSGKEIGPAWDAGSTWNREHTWPNSKGTGAGGTSALREADIMMLRPVPSNENSSRGNTAYGDSKGYFNPNSGSYDVRGDVARILLYVYTCWGGHSDAAYHNGALEYMWGENGVIESKDVLLRWLEEDPVDTWELGRNDSVQSITGTRNVFVDFPELGFLLFNEEIPSGYTTPSGNAGNGTNFAITAVSGNTAYGTVSLGGKIITASPKTGYEVAGYTILSGSAEVVQDGNLFAVTAYSDVKVQINFKARSQVTLKFSEYGTITQTSVLYKGDSMVLPSVKNAVQSGHTFVGWVAAPTGDVETSPTIYGVGDRYTVNQNTVLYALYTRTESGGNNSDLFEPYSGTLTEGDYIIVDKSAGTVAMVAAATDKNRLQYANITFVGNNIIAPASDIIWSLKQSGGYWTMYNAAKKAYAGGTGTKNQAKLLTSVTTMAQWTVQYKTSTTYEFINRGHEEKGINPMLRRNGEVGWACYAKNTTSGAPLYLYKRAAGTVYYFTQIGPVVCSHADTSSVSAVAPKCDSVGYTAGVYCNDCDEFISGHEEIPASGHSYNAVVTPPQAGIPGYTTYTCHNCGDSYQSDYTRFQAAMVSGVTYETVEEACAAANGSTVKLLQDMADMVTVEGAVFLDLNGCTALIDAVKVYATDSSASVSTAGTGMLITTGQVERSYNGYVAVQEADVYTFHALEMELTTVTLQTAKAGIYYKATYRCDEVLQELVEHYGVVLSLQNMPGADFATEADINQYTQYSGESFRSAYGTDHTVSTISGAVVGILKTSHRDASNRANANRKIYANVYLTLTVNGETVQILADTANAGKTVEDATFSGTAYSLVDVLALIDANWDAYTQADQQMIRAFRQKWAMFL